MSKSISGAGDEVSDRVICGLLLLTGVKAALVVNVGTTLFSGIGSVLVESRVKSVVLLVDMTAKSVLLPLGRTVESALLLIGMTVELAPVLESREALVETAAVLLVDFTEGCMMPPCAVMVIILPVSAFLLVASLTVTFCFLARVSFPTIGDLKYILITHVLVIPLTRFFFLLQLIFKWDGQKLIK